MQNYYDFVNRGPAVLTHLPHLEDLLLNGRRGVRSAIDILTDLGHQLEGEGPSALTISTKWDGSPAIVFGPDPIDGRFFVSTKAVLSAARKMAKTHVEIDELFPEYIAPQLHRCLDELPALNTSYVMQGDFLFRNEDLTTLSMDGKANLLAFQPNTIRYTVPYDSRMSERLRAAAMGIVIHTVYTSEWTATPIDRALFATLAHTPRVFVADPTFRFLPAETVFTVEESFDFAAALETAMRISVTLDSDIYNTVSSEPFQSLVYKFINHTVREGINPTPRECVTEFFLFLERKGIKEAEARRSADGKLAQLNKYADLRAAVLGKQSLWEAWFSLFRAVQSAKNLVLNKLTRPSEFETWLKGPQGSYVRTGPEGFVVSAGDGTTVKLVDRAVFSRANLSRGQFEKGLIGKP